jgi:hypothetical protein
MLTTANINTLFLDLMPVLVALCAWLYQWSMQRLPERQRASLEQFARIATSKIEQVFPNAGSANKKQLATSLVEDLFKSFGLPTPDSRAIDAAIESAVLAINQAPGSKTNLAGDGLLSSSQPVASQEQVAQ